MPRFALDIDSVARPVRAQALLDAVNHRVVIADGAMGTMLQGRDLSLEEDFQGLEGCNEILNDTRPDVLADIHDAYFATGIDAVETNTFGANWSNLSDYGIDDRIEELAQQGRQNRPRTRRSSRRNRRPDALGPGLHGPRHQTPQPRPHHLRTTSSRPSPCRPRASSTAARTRSSSKPARTSCRPRPPSTAASRPSSPRESASPSSSR